MNKRTSIVSFSVLMLICLTGFVCGQPGWGPVVNSPEIKPDNTVIFRYLAPDAKKVFVDAQFQKGRALMMKDSSGVWSVTLGPVKPDMYPYHFIVDGVHVADPRNSAIFPNEGFRNSIVEITGETPLVHTIQNVPHGTLSYRYYQSPELGTRPVVIYTPPGYDNDKNIKYPVLYLLHLSLIHI